MVSKNIGTLWFGIGRPDEQQLEGLDFVIMIDLVKAKEQFQDYINNYNNQDDPGFELKVVHTYHVVDNAIEII